MGLIVSKPVEISKIILVVPNENLDHAVRVLEESQAVHIEKISEKIEEYLPIINRVNDVLGKIQNLMERIRGEVVDVNITILDYETATIDVIEGEVNKLYREVEELVKEKERLVSLIDKLEEARKVLPNLPGDLEVKYLNYVGKHFSLITIYGKVENFKTFLEQCSGVEVVYSRVLEGNVFAIVASTKTGLNDLIELARNVGLKPFSNETLVEMYGGGIKVSEAFTRVVKDIAKLNEEVNIVDNKIRSIIKSSLKELAKYRVILENKYGELLSISGFLKSKYICVIKGWVPKSKVNEVKSRLNEKCPIVYLEVKDPVKGVDNPPTLMKNPKFLEWFEPIVKFIGIPNYWEWDPTPIFAYSFSLFFGIMLGDIGYAAALILAALFVLDKFVKEPFNRDYVFFKKSIVFSSIIGLVIGCLFGSVFGVSIHNLLGDPTKPEFLQGFLAVVLLIGLVHINIGHAFALIKAIKNRSLGNVMSESGLFVAEAFGIPFVLYRFLGVNVLNVSGEAYSLMLYPVALGVVLIIVGYIKNYGALGGILWIFSITGVLGDVLSYSRLAGVGLASLFLAQSFNQLAVTAFSGLSNSVPIVGLILGALLALVVLVFGHFLNTVLSAIGCFVHSLRLCFIEFLTKFYEGNGTLFEPLRVVTRRRFVLE